ncbi:hypothetical protein pb186bvf_009137 [Paramecium bursaria]
MIKLRKSKPQINGNMRISGIILDEQLIYSTKYIFNIFILILIKALNQFSPQMCIKIILIQYDDYGLLQY